MNGVRRLVPSAPYVGAVWGRNARVFVKVWRGAVLPTFLDPFMYLAGIGFGLGRYVGQIQGESYGAFLAPGLIAAAAMAAAGFESTYSIYGRINDLRVYDNILCTGVEAADLVAGDILWAATRATIAASVFEAVAAALGVISTPWAVLIIPVVWLGGLCFAVCGYTVTTLITRIEWYNYYFRLWTTPQFLLGGIFFPLASLPGWVEKVAWISPLYHLAQVGRELTPAHGAPDGAQVAIHVAWLLVVSLALFPIPVLALRKKLVA